MTGYVGDAREFHRAGEKLFGPLNLETEVVLSFV
jgi:hypothetical protein